MRRAYGIDEWSGLLCEATVREDGTIDLRFVADPTKPWPPQRVNVGYVGLPYAP